MTQPKTAKSTEFERRVREIARLRWQRPVHPDRFAGVNADIVVEMAPDHVICIETTLNHTLDKVRGDLNRLVSIKNSFWIKSIYCQGYCVLDQDPTPAMRDAGHALNIKILSFSEFESEFFDYAAYFGARKDKAFGSAVDMVSGLQDKTKYTPVTYINKKTDKEVSLTDIARSILSGHQVVLLGDFGTGKSRCAQEVFYELQRTALGSVQHAIAINIRENWGVKRAEEMLRRHCSDLGQENMGDTLIRLLAANKLLLILDGFDEIGTQSWTNSADERLSDRLKQVRRQSLIAVGDIVKKSKAGALITGREHYFNNDEEMFQCLGLSEDRSIVLRCKSEFSEREFLAYASGIFAAKNIPAGVPRRPLVLKIISELSAADLEEISRQEGEGSFWALLFDRICAREAKIHHVLDSEKIKDVLIRLGRVCRSKDSMVGPISLTELVSTFERVVGFPPVEESLTMLQRLAFLGRIGAESEDRQFFDSSIVDALWGFDLIELCYGDDTSVYMERWKHPAGRVALSIVADDISTSDNKYMYFKLLKGIGGRPNQQLAADIVAALISAAEGEIDFEGTKIKDCDISLLDLSRVRVQRLSFSSAVIGDLEISSELDHSVDIESCIVEHIVGVSSAVGLPTWVRNCSVEVYDSIHNTRAIRDRNLSPVQKLFLAIVKKIFFQPGAGREEEALVRGLGESGDRKLANAILGMLSREGIIDRFRGKSGWVYTPVGRHRRRLGEISAQLTLSQDPLWKKLDTL